MMVTMVAEKQNHMRLNETLTALTETAKHRSDRRTNRHAKSMSTSLSAQCV